jgi:hypothetical protein
MGRGTDLAILGSAAGLAALTFAATRPMAAENCNIREATPLPFGERDRWDSLRLSRR